MANYEESTNIKLDWAMPLQRTGKFPLDRSSMFSSYNDAVKYAKGDTSDPDSRGLCGSSYIGQQICVYENDEVKLYVIDQDRTLKTANSDNIMLVTFTEDTSKTLTADKSVAEIRESYNSNKAVIGVVYADVSKTYKFVALDKIDSQEVVFSYTTYVSGDFPRITKFAVGGTEQNGQDVWMSQFTQEDLSDYQTKYNMDSSIGSEPSEINPKKYPSTKAVYDFVTENANNFIVNITTSGSEGNKSITANKTYDEIKNAIDSKKNVVGIALGAFGEDVVYYMQPYLIASDNIIIFHSLLDATIEMNFAVNNKDEWEFMGVSILNSRSIIDIVQDKDDKHVPSSSAVYNALTRKLNIWAVVQSIGTSTTEVMSQKAVYNYGQSIKTLGLTNTTSNQIVSIATVDDNGAPKSYSTLDIASDDDVNTMITEILGSYSTQQQPSSIILNSNTTNSTKQFELTIDDTGTLTSQEL